jgi:hypothetical protein
VAIVETQKQHVGIEVTQSFSAIITTTRVEVVVAPNMDVVRKGVVIGYVVNVNCGSRGFLARRNLNRSSRLPIASIGIVGTPHMVFTNPIMIIHVHKTTN